MLIFEKMEDYLRDLTNAVYVTYYEIYLYLICHK